MTVFCTCSYSVDDTRLSWGHFQRAGGLTVIADVVLRDGMPCADEASFVHTIADGEPKPEDVRFALSQIEAHVLDRMQAEAGESD